MKLFKGFVCLVAIVMVLSWATLSRAADIVIGFSGPLSGPAAEYGQDIVFGVDMAIKELNAAGGVTVKGQKYNFKLEKLDDRIDPTQAVNNARRLRGNGAIAIFSGVFNTIAPMMKINEEKGNEFIMMAYTSTPKVTEMGNKLTVVEVGPFTSYVEAFSDWAISKGWRKCATMITLGSYGDEWRHAFKAAWERKGGKITIEKPANYYTETDFSAPLTAALATKPDCMLIGGPSATTALVIEQVRSMGFKGGLILIDQAKQDVIEDLLKDTKIIGNLIGTAGVSSFRALPGQNFSERFRQAYKRMSTWEAAVNYNSMYALARAITAAGTANDVYKIRAAFPKAFPLLADKFPGEAFGINDEGRMLSFLVVQTRTNGKADPTVMYAWWPKTKDEYEKIKKLSKTDPSVERKWLNLSK
jgi:branched-chain amino acid transport system substrate-binding protein